MTKIKPAEIELSDNESPKDEALDDVLKEIKLIEAQIKKNELLKKRDLPEVLLQKEAALNDKEHELNVAEAEFASKQIALYQDLGNRKEQMDKVVRDTLIKFQLEYEGKQAMLEGEIAKAKSLIAANEEADRKLLFAEAEELRLKQIAERLNIKETALIQKEESIVTELESRWQEKLSTIKDKEETLSRLGKQFRSYLLNFQNTYNLKITQREYIFLEELIEEVK